MIPIILNLWRCTWQAKQRTVARRTDCFAGVAKHWIFPKPTSSFPHIQMTGTFCWAFFLDEHGSPTYFIPNSMMFGSVAAVYACNRVSRASWFLLTRLLVLPAALFYDDFPLFRQQGSGGRLDHPPNRKRQNTHTHTKKKYTHTLYRSVVFLLGVFVSRGCI